MKTKLSFRLLALFLTLLILVSALPLSIISADTIDKSTEQSNAESLGASPAQDKGKTGGGLREITDLREENVKHFALEDGSYEAVSYGGAVHRKGADDKWVDIDNRLTLKDEKGVKRFSSADSRISFAESASSDGSIWTLSENGYTIALSLAVTEFRDTPKADVKNHDAREKQVKSAKDLSELVTVDNRTKVLYRDVLPNVDLEYVLTGNDVKENILILAPRDSYVFTFKIALSGLTPKLNEAGEILLLDEKSGEAVYELPAPYMTDAKDAFSNDVAYRLTEIEKGEYAVEISASSEWINDPERVFPIAIDPTVYKSTGCYDTYIDEASPNSNYGSSTTLWVSNYCTTLIRFSSLPTLPTGASFNTGKLFVYYYYNVSSGYLTAKLYKVLGSWSESTVTYNTAPQIDTTAQVSVRWNASSNITSSSPASTYFPLDGLFREWYSGNATNYGVAIKRGSGSNQSVIVRSSEVSSHSPYIVVNYYLDANIPEGIYQIKNASTGNYVQVDNAGTGSGSVVGLSSNNTYGEHQQFLIKKVGGNEYTIRPIHAMTMGVKTFSAVDTGVTINSYDPNSATQRFTISQSDNGHYVIRTKSSNFEYVWAQMNGNQSRVSQQTFYASYLWEQWDFEYAGPTSGVYAFQKSGTNSYADCTLHSTFGYDNEFTSSTGYHIGQCTLESPPTQGADAFNALFKLIFRPATQDYVIRSMLDNLLVLTHVSGNPSPKKNISITDDTTTFSYSWKITRISQNNYYIWFETSGGTKYYLTMPSSGRLTTVNNRDSATVWSLPQYTETAQGISVYKVPDSQFVQPGDSVNMSWVTNIFKYSYYSTAIGVNTPGEVTYSVSNNDATGTATSVASVSNDGIIHFNTQKAGLVRFTALYSTGVSFSTNLYLNPTSDTFFLLQNTQGGISFAEGTSSGATRTALSNDSVTDRQTWQLVDTEWTGYYYIRNVGTGLYLSVPNNTTMDADLVMVSSATGNRQAWKFTQTNSGRWKIRSRRDELANNNLFINVDPSTNKLIQGTFVLNNSYYDEFNVIELGGDVVFHRVSTFGYVYDPSEEISVLAKYYSKYTLIHNDIGMDLPTAKNLLQNSKIMVFQGHGTPSSIFIHEKPIGRIRNTDIFTLGDPDNSLDLSGTDIVIFEGCSTAGNPCPYCHEKNELPENYYSPVTDDHYPDCPYSDIIPINLPLSAILAGARVSIGWTVPQRGNYMNDWTELFFTKLATVDPSTGELYTACQAWLSTNNHYIYHETDTDAEYSLLYENRTTGLDEFRLSD